jgi:hypothetical protein
MFDISQIDNYLLVVAAATLGFLIRLVKKFFKDKIHPIDYINCFFFRTVSSWLTILGTTLGTYAATGGAIDFNSFITYVTMAYMADSIVNKEPSVEEAEDYRLAVEERNTVKRLERERKLAERKAKIDNQLAEHERELSKLRGEQ